MCSGFPKKYLVCRAIETILLVTKVRSQAKWDKKIAEMGRMQKVKDPNHQEFEPLFVHSTIAHLRSMLKMKT
jgi:hypothetical protein